MAAPILGRLGDGRHRREAMLAALAVVCVGGVVAAAARSLPLLIAGRVMQGVGFGMLPLAMAAARDHMPEERVPAAIGLLSVTGAAGIGAGYPLSGLVAEAFDVHAAFLFGTVIGFAALVAVYRTVPSTRDSADTVALDLTGALVGAVGLVALLLGVGRASQWGWGSAPVLGCFAIAAVVLAIWVRLQLHRPEPLVDLSQLRHASVLAADLAAVLLGVALYIFLTVVTEFVQNPTEAGFGFGVTALVAGFCLVPFSIFSLLASRAMGVATARFGTRFVLVLGAFAISASGIFFALVHDSLWQAFLMLGLLGVGFGFSFAAIPGLITRAVPGSEVGSAMGFYTVVRAIGFSVGSALVATILAAHETGAGGAPTVEGFTTALWVGVGACAVAAVIAAVFAPDERTPLDPAAARMARDDAELGGVGLIDGPVSERRRG